MLSPLLSSGISPAEIPFLQILELNLQTIVTDKNRTVMKLI